MTERGQGWFPTPERADFLEARRGAREALTIKRAAVADSHERMHWLEAALVPPRRPPAPHSCDGELAR